MWFYLPLLVETAALIGMAALDYREKVIEKQNAPAESILGKIDDDEYQMRTFEDESRPRQGGNKKKRKR
jgi:hypothetical protein